MCNYFFHPGYNREVIQCSHNLKELGEQHSCSSYGHCHSFLVPPTMQLIIGCVFDAGDQKKVTRCPLFY